ncbi:Clp protease ClpP [Aquimarina intermedia]|uniref:ATP-dependent Clp protease proteolytic subunit n=1 Tax=Aquimarina intermedia TaxID=350814 RepID=A0A5S5BWD1_9FLAO|nr:Clp protease ClpP [Aquimarina intermedia]TYP71485.1 ATP-dependent protease ClpP protease subunit [Aquimarina intermedia]
MIGVLNIHGIIGEIPDENGNIMQPNVTFLDVVQQVESQKGITQLDVFIKSPGGFVEEGDDTYNYLISLKQKGVRIRTIVEEVCASAAIKILLAGDERLLIDRPEIMIHNPFGAPGEGDADEIEAYYKDLRRMENGIIDFYASTTGTSKEAIKPLMKKETFLTPEQAIEFGFATGFYTKIPLNAVAFSKNLITKSNKMSNTLDKKEAETLVDKLLSGLKNFGKSEKPKNLKVIQDANGTELEFPDLEPDDTPTVGAKTTADAAEYVMPNGETYVVEDGELKEIKPKEEEAPSEEMAALEEKIENLVTELAERDNTIQALQKTNKENSKAIKGFETEFLALKRSIGSSFKHEKGERKEQHQDQKRQVWKKKDQD